MPNDALSRPPILTLGIRGHERASFISLLTCHGINLLIDARARPFSLTMPQFSADMLEKALIPWGVRYRFLGWTLGGHRSTSGVEDAVALERGVDRILEYWRQPRRLALLCATSLPERCRQADRIAQALVSRGARVIHIRGDGRLEPHAPDWNDAPVARPVVEEGS